MILYVHMPVCLSVWHMSRNLLLLSLNVWFKLAQISKNNLKIHVGQAVGSFADSDFCRIYALSLVSVVVGKNVATSVLVRTGYCRLLLAQLNSHQMESCTVSSVGRAMAFHHSISGLIPGVDMLEWLWVPLQKGCVFFSFLHQCRPHTPTRVYRQCKLCILCGIIMLVHCVCTLVHAHTQAHTHACACRHTHILENK